MVGEAEVVARRVERVEEGKVLLCFRIFCIFVIIDLCIFVFLYFYSLFMTMPL